MTLQLIGRSSSHFTRVARLFAHELRVPLELVPLHAITSSDPEIYAANPALKFPTLRRPDGSLVFGHENICRVLAELAPTPVRIVWPEDARSDVARNAQELVRHGLAAQVQLVFGVTVNQLPADNPYFVKGAAGLAGALAWLDAHLDETLAALPAPRALSWLEVALFCLLEHMTFRVTIPLDDFPRLVAFARDFGDRDSARATIYQYDPAPVVS
jgi:glutathione S-transferase